MEDLRGKVAFITGGAQGIGLGMARAFRSEGCELVLVDIDKAALDAARAELGAATYELDVRDRDAYEAVVADAEASVGPIAVACNNAGVGGGASVSQMTYAMWDWVLDVNIGGVVNGIQTIVPRMLERGTGHIVNTASGAGLVSTDGTGFMYNASKYAVVGLSESIRYDLDKRGIGVSVLCPGPVATDIFDHTEAGRPDKRELNEKQRASFDKTNRWLREKGTSPDAVGHMVVDGVKANALYIHTDRAVENAVLKRAQRIVAAMPPA
jgi:NAD(P)-dependent dehydrogenase (short-subunit alcohol dehydrogenase family)